MAMRLDLEPFVGAGKLRFGMSEAEAGEALDSYEMEWEHTDFGNEVPDSRIIADSSNLLLSFDDLGLEAIEFCPGTCPWFRDTNLMERTFLDFVRIINSVGRANWLWDGGWSAQRRFRHWVFKRRFVLYRGSR